eukprot:15441546-Alexandrium_andersonii.AAC.1
MRLRTPSISALAGSSAVRANNGAGAACAPWELRAPRLRPILDPRRPMLERLNQMCMLGEANCRLRR